MYQIVVLTILVIVLLIISSGGSYLQGKEKTRLFIIAVILSVCMIGSLGYLSNYDVHILQRYDKGEIIRQIKYEKQDSLYIPIDTVYLDVKTKQVL